MPAFEKRIDRACNRDDVAERFDDPMVSASISRFSKVGNFISYSRVVKCTHESAGKRSTGRNGKIGNPHLRWAFGEAACLFLRRNGAAQARHEELVGRYGKAKALSVIAQRLGRTVYTMLKRRSAFGDCHPASPRRTAAGIQAADWTDAVLLF